MERKKNSRILILIVIIILVGAGGVYAYVSQRQKANKVTDAPTAEKSDDNIDDIYGDDLEEAKEAEEAEAKKEATEDKKTVGGDESGEKTISSQPIVNGAVNFKISQLNVDGHYNGSNKVGYQITRDGTIFNITFYSEDLSKDYSGEMIARYSRIPKGGIYKKANKNIEQYYQESLTANKNNPNSMLTVRKVGDYYYVFEAGETVFLDKDGSRGKDATVQEGVLKGLKNHFATLVEI